MFNCKEMANQIPIVCNIQQALCWILQKSSIKGISPFWSHVCFFHSKVSGSFMLNFAKLASRASPLSEDMFVFWPFQSFSKLYAEFSKIWHQGVLPFLKERIVFGHSKVHPLHLSCQVHPLHLSYSNNIRNSWLLLTEPSHSAAGDSRAHTLSVMIRGRRSRPLMMRGMTTGSSLQESCLLTATGRDNRELEAWFCLQKRFNTSSFSSSCQLQEIE